MTPDVYSLPSQVPSQVPSHHSMYQAGGYTYPTIAQLPPAPPSQRYAYQQQANPTPSVARPPPNAPAPWDSKTGRPFIGCHLATAIIAEAMGLPIELYSLLETIMIDSGSTVDLVRRGAFKGKIRKSNRPIGIDSMQDNKSAILLETNGRSSAGQRSRAINIRYFFITDQVATGNAVIQYCPTDLMMGDFMTKPLQGSKFTAWRDTIMNSGFDPETSPVTPGNQDPGSNPQVWGGPIGAIGTSPCDVPPCLRLRAQFSDTSLHMHLSFSTTGFSDRYGAFLGRIEYT